jgi:hypothetical protein
LTEKARHVNLNKINAKKKRVHEREVYREFSTNNRAERR